MRKLTADFLFHDGRLLRNHALLVNNNGTIEAITQDLTAAEKFGGILSPGLINSHCHLELSHLLGRFPEGTGMAGFASRVVSSRGEFSEETVLQHAATAAESMQGQGIVAVGDISNQPVTAGIKRSWAGKGLRFHTFIELIGFFPERAQEVYETGLSLLEKFEPGTASLSPHAPYSLSPTLWKLLTHHASVTETPLSIHLLESRQERQMFESHEGELFTFLHGLGLPFAASVFSSPLEFVCSELNHLSHLLLVHNTEMNENELKATCENFPGAWFVLCPRTNYYIHRTVPDALLFNRVAGNKVCLGTDSLASNHSLDLVAEMIHLQQHFPALSTETLLTWATLNGATALGMEKQLGSFEPGKKPGVVQLSGVSPENGNLSPQSKSLRII